MVSKELHRICEIDWHILQWWNYIVCWSLMNSSKWWFDTLDNPVIHQLMVPYWTIFSRCWPFSCSLTSFTRACHRRAYPFPILFADIFVWFNLYGPCAFFLVAYDAYVCFLFIWAVKKNPILTLCTHKGLSRILSFYFRGHNAGFRETTATTTSFADLSRWKGKSCNRGHDSCPAETFS